MTHHEAVASRLKVLEYMTAHPNAKLRETAEALGLSEAVVSNARSHLAMKLRERYELRQADYINAIEAQVPQAIETLSRATDPKRKKVDHVAIMAANSILDRAGLKASDRLAITGADGGPIQTDSKIEIILRKPDAS